MFLLLAVVSLMIPAISQSWAHSKKISTIAQSRGTAVAIIVSYCLWLVFQLGTKRNMFEVFGEKVPSRAFSLDEGEVRKKFAAAGLASAAPGGGHVSRENLLREDEGGEAETHMRLSTAAIAIVFSTVLLVFNTKFAAESMQGIMEEREISQTFMGLVIIPLLSMDLTAVKCAWNDKMDMSLTLTLEKCMQMALLVVPLIVIIAWGMGIDERTLDYYGSRSLRCLLRSSL